MIENDPPPLEVASRVLAAPTLAVLGRSPFTRRGWSILDRWATQYPDALKAFEAWGRGALQERLLEQQERESRALLELADQADAGLSEMELLELAGIDTSLYVPLEGELPMLKEQQRKDAEDVAAGRRTVRSLWAFQLGDLEGFTFTPSPTSEHDKPGDGW